MLIALISLYLKISLALGMAAAAFSFYIYAYELGRGSGERLILGEVSASQAGKALLTVVLEGLSWAAFTALTPFALIGDFMGWGRPSRGTRRPVLLVHGYMHNRMAWIYLGPKLRAAGWTQVYTINLQPAGGDLMDFARQVDDAVERICRETGSETVDYIGHSMGGVVGRLYVDHYSGGDRLRHLITLGSPHRGTLSAALGPFKNSLQMTTDSEISQEVNELGEGFHGLATLSVYTEHDNIVIPAENSVLPEPAKNERLSGMGHAALLFSSRVWELIREALLVEPPAGVEDGTAETA